MGKMKIDDSLKAIAANNAARMGSNVIKIGDFTNHGITNAMDSIYGKGCVISVPTMEEINSTPGLIGFETFTANGRPTKAPYVWCPSSEGNKKMFLSQLTRNITPYKEENGTYVRDGEAVNSGTKLYQKLVGIRDAGTLLQAVAGMDIEVLDVKTGKQAAYTSGVISGLRDYNLPCFEEHKASTK